MGGVIDEDGQQWEHCNGCTKFVKFQSLGYEQPSTKFRYGRDLCPACLKLSRANFACDIEPDPEEVKTRAKIAEQLRQEMLGKEYVFEDLPDGSTRVHIVSVN